MIQKIATITIVLVLYLPPIYSQDDFELNLDDLSSELSDLESNDLNLDDLDQQETSSKKNRSHKTDKEIEAINLDILESQLSRSQHNNFLDMENTTSDLSTEEVPLTDREIETTNLDNLESQLSDSQRNDFLNIENIDPDLLIEESVKAAQDDQFSPISPEIFDIGLDEKKLLELAKHIKSKIPSSEWNAIAAKKTTDHYIVQKGDWLWKISKQLFGSGFYYAKIWALNPQITNPHELEPGMVLLLTSGDTDEMPRVTISAFEDMPSQQGTDSSNNEQKENSQQVTAFSNLNFRGFTTSSPPPWLFEREKLIKEGVFFQYASSDTYQDLFNMEALMFNEEYKKYNPILPERLQPPKQDAPLGVGSFEKDFGVQKVKRGNFLNTFITTNMVQDFGFIDSFRDESIHVTQNQYVYIRFNPDTYVNSGDKFSIYKAQGEVKHELSDRRGFRYTIIAHIKVNRKINDLWECQIQDTAELVSRGDRVTIHIPNIQTVAKVYSKRLIEGIIIDTYMRSNSISQGDLVYLDRGRSDGVEAGTIFSIYDFFDRGTKKKITQNPTYSIGTLQVLNVQDNFSTALSTSSTDYTEVGRLAVTMSEQQALEILAQKKINAANISSDSTDMELNVGTLSDDLLQDAHKIQLSKDELNELSRKERQKSILKEHERDLQELALLEEEINNTETSIRELQVDEDKFLEQMDLNSMERYDPKDPNAFKSLNEIEKDVGRKYMDENLNSKENPYGLTEFDIEEIDELLNTESL